MKIALAHDWLTSMGGAEVVLEEMTKIFPDAPIYTLFSDPLKLKDTIFADKRIINSSLQQIPFMTKMYRKLPNFFPQAIEEFELSEFDVVWSSSHAVAKGIVTDAKTCHISYIHTPMRYIWDLTYMYLRQANFPAPIAWYTKKVFHDLRSWDVMSSLRPDFLVANSVFVKNRIWKIYRRHADVIYPAVPLSSKVYTEKQNYYVTASRLVPYKNVPLIAEAFSKMPDKKLVILGDGPESKRITRLAEQFPNLEYLGYQGRDVLMQTIGNAKAFVFAAEEDFGILPVEAQSLGTPVIAYGVGGARETILDHKTGLFFLEQTPNSICDAINVFEKIEDKFDPAIIVAHTKKFSQERFQEEIKKYTHDAYQKFSENNKFGSTF